MIARDHLDRRSTHDDGRVGSGDSLHADMEFVGGGTRDADERLRRVHACDPGSGVVRHADGGSPEAIRTAARHGIQKPMRHTVH